MGGVTIMFLSIHPAGGGTPASIGAPASREVINPSTAYTVSCTAPSDNSVTFKVNGSTVGTMTPAGSHVFTYAWTTPGTAASEVDLTFVGDVSGTSPVTIVTISTNTMPDYSTPWGNSGWGNTSIAAGINHPEGGAGTVYKFVPFVTGTQNFSINKTASPINTVTNAGFETWLGIKSGSVFDTLFIQTNAGYGNYLDPKTGMCTAADTYVKVVQKVTNAQADWYRIQFLNRDSAPGGIMSGTILQFTTDLGVANGTVVSTTNDIIYLADPRTIGEVTLPFSQAMRMQSHLNNSTTPGLAATTPGAQEWNYKHPWVDSGANMAGGSYPGGIQVRVIRPSGWVSTGNYPCLVFLAPLTDGGEGTNPKCWDACIDAAANYANTYNCVVCQPYDRSNDYWWGVKSDGTKNLADWLPQVLVPWLIEYHGVSSARNDHLILGYSKSANAAVAQILLNPTVWGYAGGWDGAWQNVYPANFASNGYDTSGLYNAHDPYQILAANKASVNDRTRLAIHGGFTFGTDYTNFVALCATNSVPINNTFTTRTFHGWGPTGINGGWTPTLVAALFSMRAAP